MTQASAFAMVAALVFATGAQGAEPSLQAMGEAAESYAEARVAGRMDELIASFPPRVTSYIQENGAKTHLLDVRHLERWGPKDFFLEFDVEDARLETAGELTYAVVPSVSRVCTAPAVVQEIAAPALMLFENGSWYVARLGPSELTTLIEAQYGELSGLPYREVAAETRGPTPEERPSCQ